MSIEDTFRSALVGYAPLTALVDVGSIGNNAVEQNATLPVIQYAVNHNLITNLAGSTVADQASVTVQCWAKSMAEAISIADQVTAAIDASLNSVADVSTMAPDYDEATGLDGVTLVIDWLE